MHGDHCSPFGDVNGFPSCCFLPGFPQSSTALLLCRKSLIRALMERFKYLQKIVDTGSYAAFTRVSPIIVATEAQEMVSNDTRCSKRS
jgi:hypothetical protein